MDSILPDELYNIIIGYVPYDKYNNLRLVHRNWYNIVEESDYSEVLKFIRIINGDPEYTVNWYKWDRVNISYYNGRFTHIVTGFPQGNIRDDYIYKNKHILPIDDDSNRLIHRVNNEHGVIELENKYININDGWVQLPGYGSHIIQTNPDLIISTSKGIHQYDKIYNAWHVISDLNSDVHIRKYITYRRDNNIITFIKNNINIAHAKLPTNNFGFGPNYFVMKTDKLYIWSYPTPSTI